MKTNMLMLDPELAGKLSDYAEGDSVQCLVTATVGKSDANGMALEVTDIEPESGQGDTGNDTGEPDTAPASGKRAPALEKAMKA